jgi:hypothetical protein
MIRSPAGFDGGVRIKRYLDYYQPSYGVMMLSAGQFSPASLFAAGEQGAWYDPSDLTTLFEDAAGTIPITTPLEKPVGLVLDKSKGLVLGSELVSNGDFSNGTTGWAPANVNITIAVVGGVGEMTSSASNIYVAQTVNVTSGKTYIVTGQGRAGTAPLLPLVVSGSVVLGTQINSSASLQPISFIFVAGAATASLRFQVQSGSGGTAYFDNISVKELPGNHATQSTSQSRPVLSARYNLLTKTEQFDDAAWGKLGCTATGNKLVANNGVTLNSTSAYISQNVNVNSAPTKLRLLAKAAGFNVLNLRIDNIIGLSSPALFARINLTTGAVISSTGGTFNVNPASDGYWEVTADNTYTSTTYVGVWPDDTVATVGNGVDGIMLFGADLRVTNDGVGLPAYQRVNTSTDYDTSGFPLYLRFDGTDDSLSTGSIDFSATDKMSVFAGVRKLSDAATGMLVELSASVASNTGAFNITAPNSTGYGFELRGSALSTYYVPTGFAAPHTAVLSGLFDIAGASRAGEVIPRINTVVSQSGGGGAADTGTGNFGNYPLYIGRRGGSSLPFNDRLYSLIVRGALSTAAQIADTETWVNNRTKAF